MFKALVRSRPSTVDVSLDSLDGDDRVIVLRRRFQSLALGDRVTVVDPDAALSGPAVVSDVSDDLVYLSVDWASLTLVRTLNVMPAAAYLMAAAITVEVSPVRVVKVMGSGRLASPVPA